MSAQAQVKIGQDASAQADGKGAPGANPIVSALHQMAVSVLGEQLREMFEKADDILFDSAEKARASDEQRLYMDTMRIVRVQRNKIIQAFQESLTKALAGIGDADETQDAAGKLDDMSQWSLEDGDVLEERIAVNNMQTKASALYSHELVELQRRLARLADMTGNGLSPESMSPLRIIRAFQSSMRDLPVDFPIKLVIYKLFDRVVVGRLSEVFVGANQLLAVHGIEPRMDAAPPAPAARGESRRQARGMPQDSAVPAWMGKLDRTTMGAFGAQATGAGFAEHGAPGAVGAGMPTGAAARWAQHLSSAGGAAGAENYSDAMLSQDVAQILGSYEQGRRPQAPSWLPPETVALVARMFDGYYRDPRLPDNLKPVLARLQLPMMKAAVADRHFFLDPHHTARRTLNELFEMLLQFGSAEASPSPQLISELQGLVDAMVQAFSLDPAKLRSAPAPEPVDERTADAFLREQEELQQKKNRARIERVRRIVAHEIRRRVGERKATPGVMRLLLSGFGPLLCLDYIRNGVNGASWTETMRLIDRVLDSLRPHDSGHAAERAAEEAEIVAAISRRLAVIGFSEERLKEVVAGLLQAYLELAEQPAAGEASPSAAWANAEAALSPERELQGLLSILLVPGSWFTVWEPLTQIKHWVRVKGYYPVQNAVMFGHYMEERFLRIRATAFATGLVEGLASPIDPSPELQSAIARISELPFERGSDPIVWTTVEGRPE